MAASTRSRRAGGVSGARIATAVVVGIILGGTSVYLGLGHSTSPALPSLWEIPNGCNNCGVAVNPHDVYRLILDNETQSGDVNYSVIANNLTTGAAAWPSTTVWIRQDFGFYMGTFGELAPFFADNNTVSLAVYGSGEQVTGQLHPLGLDGFGILVLEWNATSGAFLGVRTSPAGAFAFTYVAATQSDGWLVVDWVAGFAPTSVLVETFPEQLPGAELSAWVQNVSMPAYNWVGWPLLPLTVGGGLVTLTVMQQNGTTVVLSAASGAVVWEGATPSLYSSEDYVGTVGYYTDVTRIGDDLYYLGNNTTTLSVMRLDLETQGAPETVVALPVEPFEFPSTELQSDRSGDLIITDAGTGSYYAYSPGGERMWSDHIALSVVSEPTLGWMGALAFAPVEVSGQYLFTALFQDSSTYSGLTGSTTTFEFSSPLQLLNETSGTVSWQRSYSASFSMDLPGPGTQPVQYAPAGAEGSDLVYLYGSAIGVAQFS